MNGAIGRLPVANLPHHDDVWRLPQHGAQRRGKGHARLAAHGHLVDAGQLIFHGILDGDDLAVGLVEVVQAGVEGRCFARAGRAGHEHDAVGQGQQPSEPLLVVAVQAEFCQAEAKAFRLQQPQDHTLAVHRGQRGHPQIKRAAGHVDAGAPVLRQAFFRNAHAGHDLEPRHDRTLQMRGRILALLQYAVDAVTDPEASFQRLKMNIGGPPADGLAEDGLDEPDDGRLVVRDHRLAIAGSSRGIRRRSGRAPAIVPLDGLADFLRRRDRRLDGEPGHMAGSVDGGEVERIADRHAQHRALPCKGKHVAALGPGLRQRRQRRGRNVHRAQINHRQAVPVGQQARQAPGVEHALLDQDVQQPRSRASRRGQRFATFPRRGQLRRGQQPLVQGQLDGGIFGGAHGGCGVDGRRADGARVRTAASG